MAHSSDLAYYDRRLRGLRRRLWFERFVFLALAALGLALHFGWLIPGERVCLVAVDGDPAAVLPTRANADRLLDTIKADSGLPSDKVEFAQRVTFHQVPAARNPLQSDSEALAALRSHLHTVVQAAAILANDQIVIGLPDQKEAVTALSFLLNALSPSDEDVTTVFQEKIKIEVRPVPTDRFVASARAAVEKLREESSPKRTHQVQPGETAWQLARQNQVSLSRLAQANPELDLDRLRAGDQLNIPGQPLPITVIAKKEIQEQVGEGPLRRTQTVRITYENGVEVRRQVIGRQRLPARAPISRGLREPRLPRPQARP
jgi:LysM repeat protein